jgi:hypothetical protein
MTELMPSWMLEPITRVVYCPRWSAYRVTFELRG